MYSLSSYNGECLADKTLCITFDDGPGEYTFDIGEYLFNEGIIATFFVVGKYACEYPQVLQSLKDFGHIIANHTYEHPDMTYYNAINGDAQSQIMRTDLTIKKYLNTQTIYYRNPYGKWSPELAADLNANMLTAIDHIGPIYWDIDGIDCYYWQTGKSVEDAVSAYHKQITAKKKGIIVFHDDIADMDYLKTQNKTLQLLKELIPILKAENYKFIGLEEIASIKKSSEDKLLYNLKCGTNKYLVLSDESNAIMHTSKNNKLGTFHMQIHLNNKVAIQATNNCYLNVEEQQGNLIFADKNEIYSNCLFDLIPIINNQFILRAINGNYLNTSKNKNLVANAKYIRNATVFSSYLTNVPIKDSLTLKIRITLIKKRLLYIKSKILNS